MSAIVPTLAMFEQLEARVAELEQRLAAERSTEPSPYLTIPEAALYLGCGHKPCPNCDGDDCRRCDGTGRVVNRQRVDDLLSARRLERVKEGARTLIRRDDLDAYLRRS